MKGEKSIRKQERKLQNYIIIYTSLDRRTNRQTDRKHTKTHGVKCAFIFILCFFVWEMDRTAKPRKTVEQIRNIYQKI